MNYLEDAMDLDIHLISDYPECNKISDYLLEEIETRLTIRKKSRTKETLKLVIINLWLSYQEGKPIKYSRNRNEYLYPKRYGKLHIKYKRLIPILDVLKDLEYLHQKIGFFDRGNKIGRQSRIFPAERLISLFKEYFARDHILIRKSQPAEIIQLKNDIKNLIDYTDTRSNRDMRTNLRRYNEFIERQKIVVCAPSDTIVNARFLFKLHLNVLKGVIEFTDFKLTDNNDISSNLNDDELYTIIYPLIIPTISGARFAEKDLILISDSSSHEKNSTGYPISVSINDDVVVDYLININDHNINQYNTHYLNHINTSTMTKTLREISDKRTRNFRLLEKRQIANFGINGLHFQSNYQYLHRVFNNESFKLGGRFYGAFHLSLPKEIRPYIRINNLPSVELDFSAMHIRMLYHLEGVDYRQDPYSALCDDIKERKIYKLVQLISINSKNADLTIKAIRDQLRKKYIQFDLTNKSIARCIEKFKWHHPTIAKYLNAGTGLKLQNLDRRITEKILRTMMQNEIPCLPVHDSYIVSADYRDLLFRVMSESYRGIMGFNPIIK